MTERVVKFGILAFIVALFIVGCSSEPETIIQEVEVEVTRLVTETEVVTETETVTETVIEEVEVTRVVEVEAPAAGPSGVLRHAVNIGLLGGWTPWQTQAPASLAYYNIPYEGLLFENADGEVVPQLAESFSYNEDNTVLTFNLREGVTFHDGTAFDADVVLANFDYIRNENGYAPLVGQLAAIESIEAPDPLTVVMTLSRPDLALLPNLARHAGLMVSPDSFATAVETPVGTGPYMYNAEASTDGSWVFDAYPNYHTPEWQPFEQMVINSVPDVNARINGILNGDYDSINIEANQLGDLANAAGLEISARPHVAFGIQIVDLNGETIPELANRDVRCAISQAIDREAIVAGPLNGFGVPGLQREVRGQYAYVEDPPDVGYNLAAAQAAMAAAGSNGFDVLTGAWGPFTFAAQAAGAGLSQIGINLEVEQIQPPDMWPSLAQGKYPLQVVPWSEVHPITLIRNRAVDGPFNPSGVVPEGVAELLAQADGLSAAEAEPIIEEIKSIMIDECIWINLYTVEGIIVHREDLVNIEPHSGKPTHFDYRLARYADQ